MVLKITNIHYQLNIISPSSQSDSKTPFAHHLKESMFHSYSGFYQSSKWLKNICISPLDMIIFMSNQFKHVFTLVEKKTLKTVAYQDRTHQKF